MTRTLQLAIVVSIATAAGCTWRTYIADLDSAPTDETADVQSQATDTPNTLLCNTQGIRSTAEQAATIARLKRT